VIQIQAIGAAAPGALTRKIEEEKTNCRLLLLDFSTSPRTAWER